MKIYYTDIVVVHLSDCNDQTQKQHSQRQISINDISMRDLKPEFKQQAQSRDIVVLKIGDKIKTLKMKI